MRRCAGLLFVTWLLGAQTQNPEQAFGDVFASVLTGENPDGGKWNEPGKYIQIDADRPVPSPSAIARTLEPAIDKYRLLIVPGFMSSCKFSAAAPAFQKAREHLRAAHGIDVTLLQVPDDSCENNGKRIAAFLRGHARGPKYIVVGHSKGAADLQLALQDPVAAASVAAFISVAGAVGGSPLADLAVGRGLLEHVQVSVGCTGKLEPAVQSITTRQRRAFNSSHPDAPVPSYSLVAASGFTTTSKILLPSWGLLGAGLRGPEDGLLLAADGTLPGAKFLGTALADHTAVAHDFEETAMAKWHDKDHYPRVALLEALVRFVIADLASRLN